MKLCGISPIVCGLILCRLALGQPEVTLSGKITDSLTHQPIAGAEITYCCAHYATATSDLNGSWSFHVTPDDSGGTLTFAKSGYAFGTMSISARPGASQTHDFELTPAAHLSGHVVDRDSGQPLAGFVVSAKSRGERAVMFVARPSGADGSFSVVAPLTPADYTMQIDPPSGQAKPDELGYGRVWYPGVTRAEMAAPITLSTGENRDIEVRLQKRALYHISGAIEASEGREKDAVVISVISGMRPLAETKVPDAGPFRIEGLPEGPCVLFATATGSGNGFAFSSRAVEITDHSIDDLKLILRPGISVRARVSMAEDGIAVPEGARFQPVSVFDVAPQPFPALDPLTLQFFRPGEYWPELVVPTGYAVTSVSFDGRPVVNSPVDLEAPESTVDFVLTSRPASLTGIVRDANQKPVADAAVSLQPEIGRRRLTSKSDANGAFHFGDLAPGKYRASVEGGTGESVELVFGQTASVELHVK